MIKTVIESVSGKYILSEPIPNGSLKLEDLILTLDQETNGGLEIYFTDGLNQAMIWKGSSKLFNINEAIPGLDWWGWQNAWLVVEVLGNANVFVSAKVKSKPIGLTYDQWIGVE